MSIVAREVEFSPGDEPQIYHAVEQADYVSIVAVTPDGKLPVVRQYRPAIEGFSWEVPAGLVEPGESPATPVAVSCSKKQDCVRAPFTP